MRSRILAAAAVLGLWGCSAGTGTFTPPANPGGGARVTSTSGGAAGGSSSGATSTAGSGSSGSSTSGSSASSSATGGSTGGPPVGGSLGGLDFAPSSVAYFPLDAGSAQAVVVLAFETTQSCASLGNPGPGRTAHVEMRSSSAIGTGTYAVDDGGALFSEDDLLVDGGVAHLLGARGGQVVLASGVVGQTDLNGSFTITPPDGGTRSGSFTASFCAH